MEVKPLITPQELATIIEQKSLIVIDTRAPKQYSVSHIPKAVNIHEIFTYLADSSKPEGLISLQSYFAEVLGTAGISGTEQLVIYEDAMNKGYGQSCRGYFLLKYLGCPKVRVLDGGYQAWLQAMPTTTEIPTPRQKSFSMNIDSSIMVTAQQMLQALDNPAIVKLDVRDYDEWMGISSSPYGIDFCPRKGRIPGAVWIEWYRMMMPNSEIPIFRPKEEILEICQEVGITPESTVYVYCFKGSRASHTLIALKGAGIKDVRNYFSSWNEWSRDLSLPIEIGEPSTAARNSKFKKLTSPSW